MAAIAVAHPVSFRSRSAMLLVEHIVAWIFLIKHSGGDVGAIAHIVIDAKRYTYAGGIVISQFYCWRLTWRVLRRWTAVKFWVYRRPIDTGTVQWRGGLLLALSAARQK